MSCHLTCSPQDKAVGHILKDSGAHHVAQDHKLKRVKMPASWKLVLLAADPDDERSWLLLMADTTGSLSQGEPNNPAALFYTSGTTGCPKPSAAELQPSGVYN